MTTALHNRHRALADLEKMIEQAEQAYVTQQAEIERITAEGREARRATIGLGFTVHRLAQLRKSRETLLSGEEGYRGGRY